MIKESKDVVGLIKTLVDVHTMGVHANAALLRDCGLKVIISPESVEYALERITLDSSQTTILNWIDENNITRIGFSYRLDPDTAVDIFGRFLHLIIQNGYFGNSESKVKSIFFAGLKPACEKIEKEYKGQFATFCGGESALETLLMMGISLDDIPNNVIEGCQYDRELNKFGNELIKSGTYSNIKPPLHNFYPQFGTMKDTLELRLDNNYKSGFQPLTRAHSGPYSDDMTREECLREFQSWCQILGKTAYLDVLSIGSSQLSQSNFGENWAGKPNGGGVPVNSEDEYRNIWDAARPMLVRTYSGSKHLKRLADIYERTINIAWHALSLWWFNELDGRGPNKLYDNLKEHLETIRFISTTRKPVETNVPHHFAFRGADDITYIISGYLAAKTAKKYGTKTYILQNMLNTPRSTWGIQDLAKSRTLLKLVKELEDKNFRVILQTRAGLDYFKPDIETAKAQLASVTALMDDIDPYNEKSPEIIHVVSYSEALFLATPEIINDSIKITRASIMQYRKLKNKGETPNVNTDEIQNRQIFLETACRQIIRAMERNIPNLYSPEGLYVAFVAGWLPVPELWTDSDEFKYAKNWQTRITKGSVVLCDHNLDVTTDYRINQCVSKIPEAIYILKQKYNIQY